MDNATHDLRTTELLAAALDAHDDDRITLAALMEPLRRRAFGFLLLLLAIPNFIPVPLGIGGVTSHYCLTNAFRAGDATLVVPLDFMRIPLIAVIGWAFYGESLDIFVLIGALIIISGVLWNLRAESIRTRPA